MNEANTDEITAKPNTKAVSLGEKFFSLLGSLERRLWPCLSVCPSV